jgi:c-di-AMP phosphodiesterase-like protein
MNATTTANPVAKRLVALVAAALLVLSLGAVPAQAQTQEGLVNVNVSDVTVQIPLAIAANICDVNVNLLAEQLRDGGAVCDANATSDAVFDPEVEDGEAPTQEGLVNVNVSNVIIQVPVAVAANICDVNVNVLARQLRGGGAACDAAAESEAIV